MSRTQRRAALKARRRDALKVHEPTSANSKLRTALSHHQAGRLTEAKRIYAEILSKKPKQARALHLLGVLKLQQGDARAASKLIGKAIAVKPDNAAAHNNLGVALQEQGRLEEAEASYRRALDLEPNYPEARDNLWQCAQRARRARGS